MNQLGFNLSAQRYIDIKTNSKNAIPGHVLVTLVVQIEGKEQLNQSFHCHPLRIYYQDLERWMDKTTKENG